MTPEPITREYVSPLVLKPHELRRRLNCLNNDPIQGHAAYTLKLKSIAGRVTAEGFVITETWEAA